MVLIIMSPNKISCYIAAGVLILSLVVVLFLAKNVSVFFLQDKTGAFSRQKLFVMFHLPFVAGSYLDSSLHFRHTRG